jgi:hypothetical protein
VSGPRFLVLNWCLQALCVTQTELFRNQVVDLTSNFKSYPAFLHAAKQVASAKATGHPCDIACRVHTHKQEWKLRLESKAILRPW